MHRYLVFDKYSKYLGVVRTLTLKYLRSTNRQIFGHVLKSLGKFNFNVVIMEEAMTSRCDDVKCCRASIYHPALRALHSNCFNSTLDIGPLATHSIDRTILFYCLPSALHPGGTLHWIVCPPTAPGRSRINWFRGGGGERVH